MLRFAQHFQRTLNTADEAVIKEGHGAVKLVGFFPSGKQMSISTLRLVPATDGGERKY